MKASLGDYIRSAFNARPIGMFIPPNWIGIGAFALLGLVNPGFWVIGAGLELAYLYALAMNTRFQKFVSGSQMLEDRRQWQSQLQTQIEALAPEDQRRYALLEQRCHAIIEQQRGSGL